MARRRYSLEYSHEKYFSIWKSWTYFYKISIGSVSILNPCIWNHILETLKKIYDVKSFSKFDYLQKHLVRECIIIWHM